MDFLIKIITSSFLSKAQKKERCRSLYQQFSKSNVHSQAEKSPICQKRALSSGLAGCPVLDHPQLLLLKLIYLLQISTETKNGS